ncbi:MAG: class I mannose-6-phosphate isomerase [Clostridiales bacterium]|nr:class I mannose-6-phosphate isomerase [Clostridiales bacterium]MDR2749157.1 class I mannose-6-phosphate isomerase [Clostridiales bacterium]
MVYPLLFKPIFKEMVWGGQKMKLQLGLDAPYEKTGEAWSVSCRPKEMGIVANGPLEGERLSFFLGKDDWLGTAASQISPFPLLVKIIDAADDLSIQVHPDDLAAQRLEGQKYGKAEMWHVMDAPEGGRLVLGLKDGVRKSEFTEAALSQSFDGLSGLLNYIPVKKGDTLFIPPGMIHAITKGVMVAEIQQSSDITYRVSDYGRLGLDGKPRELHVEKAAQCADFSGKQRKSAVPGLCAGQMTYLLSNRHFAVISLSLSQEAHFVSDPEKFFLFTCIDGEFSIISEGMSVSLTPGMTALAPAGLGSFSLRPAGRCEILKSFVPTALADFIEPLQKAGFSMEEIQEKTAYEPH